MFNAVLLVLALNGPDAIVPKTNELSPPPAPEQCVISAPDVLDALAWVEASREAFLTKRPRQAVNHGLLLAGDALRRSRERPTSTRLDLLLASALEDVREAGAQFAEGHADEVPLLLTKAEATLHVAVNRTRPPLFSAALVILEMLGFKEGGASGAGCEAGAHIEASELS